MKWWHWIIIVAIVGAAIYFAFMWWMEKQVKEKQKDYAKENPKVQVNTATITWPLKRGDVNNAVKNVQKYLNSPMSEAECDNRFRHRVKYKGEPLFPLNPDGSFGERTERAIRECYGKTTVSKSEYNNLMTKL